MKKPHKIPFLNKNGDILLLPSNLTIRDLVEMGVTNIGLIEPHIPLSDNEFRSLDEFREKVVLAAIKEDKRKKKDQSKKKKTKKK